MTRIAAIHSYHRTRRYRAALATTSNRAAPAPRPDAGILGWAAIAIIAIVMLLVASGCKPSIPTNPANAATGNAIAVTGALLGQLPPHVNPPGKPILDAAVKSNYTAGKENITQAKEFDRAISALADEVEDHQKDNEKRDGEIRSLKAMAGYRVEMFIRRVLGIVKWVLIIFGAWGVIGGALSFAVPGIGGPVLGIWLSIVKGILSRVLGMVKGHQANAGAGGTA